MRAHIGKAIILGFAVATATAVGCSSTHGGNSPSAVESTGSAGLMLTLPGGITINTVHVVISGPTPKTFDQNVSSASGVVQADGTVAINLGTIAGLAPGSYTVTISATSADGSVVCTGAAAPFTVTANATATVTAYATCRTAAPDAGQVTIGGDFSNCGRVTSLSDNIGETTVGQTITFNGSSTGPNTAGLTWAFTASPADGTFAPATGTGGAPTATFTCTAAGTVQVTLTVADGTVPSQAPNCNDVNNKTITVVCDPSAVVIEAGAPDTSVADTSVADTFVADTFVAPDTFVADTHTVNPLDAHCGTNNGGAGCTATELLLVQKDTNADGTGKTGKTAFGCYDCLVGAGCLDDKLFASDVDHECGDTGTGGITNPTLSGDTATASCLAVVSCVLGGNCASASGDGTCYCGTATGSACTVAGGPNGACLTQEQDGTNTTSPPVVNSRFTDISYAAGMANTIFSCAASNSCTQCFP